MDRYILLNDGSGDGGEAVTLLERMTDVRVLDRTDDRAILIEASLDAVERIGRALPGWRLTPEIRYAMPKPPFPRPGWKLTTPQPAPKRSPRSRDD